MKRYRDFLEEDEDAREDDKKKKSWKDKQREKLSDRFREDD